MTVQPNVAFGKVSDNTNSVHVTCKIHGMDSNKPTTKVYNDNKRMGNIQVSY